MSYLFGGLYGVVGGMEKEKEMPAFDPAISAIRAVRKQRRRERRARLVEKLRQIIAELDEWSDEVEEEVRDFVEAPGAPSNPDFKGPGG